MTITVAELRTLCKLLLDKLQSDADVVDLGDQDMYWKILGSDAFDLSKDAEPAVGSLIDDVRSLQALAKEKSPTPAFTDFDRLAAVFMAISEANNPA